MASLSKTELNGQLTLEEELERLKKVLNRGHELKVQWIPRENGKLSGEVRGEHIRVYDEDVGLAIETLKHEFVDHAVSKVIEPYMQVTNKLIGLLNEKAYQEKERLVEKLASLL